MTVLILLNSPNTADCAGVARNMMQPGWVTIPIAADWEAGVKMFEHTGTTIVIPNVEYAEDFYRSIDLVGCGNVYLMRIIDPAWPWDSYIRTDIAVFGNGEVSVMRDLGYDMLLLETQVFANGFVARARKAKK